MSITTHRVPILQRSPRVWGNGECLYARTNLWFQILNLFFYSRLVIAHKPTKRIVITIRTFWFLKRVQVIPFDWVRSVDRVTWEVPESYSLFVGVTDVTEIWYVRLLMKSSQSPINIFRFYGDGSRLTGWKGVILGGDSVVDWEGIQDEKSEAYAKALANVIGVACVA